MSDFIFSCQHEKDFFDTLKIILPSIIASMALIVSTLAFRVSKTQREIASNKYQLDLFDKRIPVYDDFFSKYVSLLDKDTEYCRKEIKEIDNLISEKCIAYFTNTKETFENISRILNNIKNYETRIKEIEENRKKREILKEKYFNPKDSIQRLQQRLLRETDAFEKSLIQEKIYENEQLYIEGDYAGTKYHQEDEDIKIIEKQIGDSITVIKFDIEIIDREIKKQLVISHYSYTEKEEIYVFQWFFDIVKWIKKLRFRRPKKRG